MPAHNPRVAIYARVSTDDQDPEVQLNQLRRLCVDRGWHLMGEFVDHGVSGTERRRPQLAHLLENVHRHTCDVVLVWKLDRLGRSTPHLLELVDTFRQLNVEFVSYRDPGLDTTTAGGKMIFTVFAAFAQFERDLISERTKAGLELARRKGIKLGRPALDIDHEAVLRDHARGFTIRQIAREHGCWPSTIWRILEHHHKGKS